MVLQGFGDASVRPVWAEKGWSTRVPWALFKLQGGCWLRGSGQCGVPGGFGRLVRRLLCDPQPTESAVFGQKSRAPNRSRWPPGL